MTYVTFLIDAGGVIDGSVSKVPDSRQPDEAGVLKVIFKQGRVTVIGRDDKMTRVIASARWRGGRLDRRTLASDAPRLTADQWTVIRESVAPHVGGLSLDALQSARPERVREVVSRSPLKLDQPSARFKAIVWGSFAAVMAVTGVLAYTCTNKPETPGATPAVKPAVAEPRVVPPAAKPAPPPEEPVELRIAKAGSFAEAIRLATPAMRDSADQLGPGATLLATYAVGKLRWDDVDVAAETTFGHVLKDAEAERGKRMCADGEIVAIQRRDLGARKIYVGTLRVSAADAIAFVAVGTTGELVRGRTARFCGAVTGTAGTSVSMVGMFDLPENRTPIVEQ